MESPGQSSMSGVQTVWTGSSILNACRILAVAPVVREGWEMLHHFIFLSLPLSACVRIVVSVPKWGTDPALIGLGGEQARPASLSSVGHGKAMVLRWIVHAVYSLDTCFRTALSGLMQDLCLFRKKDWQLSLTLVSVDMGLYNMHF